MVNNPKFNQSLINTDKNITSLTYLGKKAADLDRNNIIIDK